MDSFSFAVTLDITPFPPLALYETVYSLTIGIIGSEGSIGVSGPSGSSGFTGSSGFSGSSLPGLAVTSKEHLRFLVFELQ
jgi:hypothetical protein